jgi:hypothetical protein
LWKDFARTPSENISTILPQLFPATPSGLAWRRIVKGITVEKLWKRVLLGSFVCKQGPTRLDLSDQMGTGLSNTFYVTVKHPIVHLSYS